MLVQRVTEFKDQLRKSSVLFEYDKIYLNKLDEQFLAFNPSDILDPLQVQSLQKMFVERWEVIVGKPADYTLTNLCENNIPWVSLARDLAEETGKTYLQILIPTVLNTLDPITFSKLADCKDLSGLYLGADKKTLYSIEGLFDRLEHQKQSFSTYNAHTGSNKYKPRPLSLFELFQIKSKGDENGTLWSYLITKFAPKWHQNGEVLNFLLQSLLAVVEQYFVDSTSVKEPKEYLNLLQVLAGELQECSIADVNCFYGQKIKVGMENVYLVDILLDCIKGDYAALHDKMWGLVGWLCDFDASLIMKTSVVQPIYATRLVGSFFDLKQLNAFILKILNPEPELTQTLSSDIKKIITDFLGLYKNKTVIDSALIKRLGEVYRRYWKEIMGGPNDYTRSQGGINGRLIRLAQLLCGAGLIKRNYYGFIMPTVEHDTDPVKLGCLTEYPLTHYIVSEDGLSLILLDNSAHHFKRSRVFYNCNSIPPTKFTEIEANKIKYAHHRFGKYRTFALSNGVDDLPISLSTVLAVKELIEGSVYYEGLYGDIDDSQIKTAQQAYYKFYNFLNKLRPEERKRLDLQCIYLNGHNRYFFEILSKVQNEGCIATNGRYFIQMAFDYDPQIKLNHRIETKLADDLSKMRAAARGKIYRNYHDIDNDEAKRRLFILMVSILTHDFKCRPPQNVLSLWDCSNRMAGVIRDIFDLLRPMIESNDFTKAMDLYATIIESFVKPNVENSWLLRVRGVSEIHRWVDSILNGTLFDQKCLWIAPEILMEVLPTLVPSVPYLHNKVEQFFDDLVHTYMQAQPASMKEVRVNIKFVKLLNELGEHQRSLLIRGLQKIDLKDAVKSTNTSLSKSKDKAVYNTYVNLLVDRIWLFCSSFQNQQGISFFGAGLGSDQRKHKQIKTKHITAMKEELYKQDLVLNDLLETVAEMMSNFDRSAHLRVSAYLENMRRPILLSESLAHSVLSMVL